MGDGVPSKAVGRVIGVITRDLRFVSKINVLTLWDFSKFALALWEQIIFHRSLGFGIWE
jgi:hypothetical protein